MFSPLPASPRMDEWPSEVIAHFVETVMMFRRGCFYWRIRGPYAPEAARHLANLHHIEFRYEFFDGAVWIKFYAPSHNSLRH